MPQKTLTFTIEGRDYPAYWESPQDPTPQDLEEIEAGIRQKYGLKSNVAQPTSNKLPTNRIPYKWGGDDPKDGGMDCSGFTCYIKKQEGIRIPRTAIEQYKGGKLVATDSLQPGDLVFFDTGANHRADNKIQDKFGNTYHVSHVGIYQGDGKMTHQSSAKGGTQTVDFEQYRKHAQYLGARRYSSAADVQAPKPVGPQSALTPAASQTPQLGPVNNLQDFGAVEGAGRALQASAKQEAERVLHSTSPGEMDINEAMARVDSALGKRITPKQRAILHDWLTEVGGYRNITSPMLQTALHYAGRGQYTELVDRGRLYRDMPFRLEDLIAARRQGKKAIDSKERRSAPYQTEYASQMVADYLGVPRSKLTDKMISPVLEDYVRAQELPFAPADLIVARNNKQRFFTGRNELDQWDVAGAEAEVAKKLGIPRSKLTSKMLTRLAKADSLPPAKLDADQKLDPLTQALADSIPDPQTDPLGFGLKLLQRGGQFAPDLLRDALGQSVLGMKRGEMYDNPHVRDSQVVKLGDTVFQIGKYFVPGVGPAMMAGDAAGVVGRAREVGTGTALKEFGGEMLHAANFFEPNLGLGEFSGRLINAAFLGLGVRHGINKAGKTVNRLILVRDLADTGKLSLAEAYQVLRVSEERAAEYVHNLRQRAERDEGPIQVMQRVEQEALPGLEHNGPLTEDLKSPQHAQAVLRAALGDFVPATPEQMKAAFDANRAQVTLSDHSPEALSEMFTFKMRDKEIYYALNPMPEHWETGRPAVDITSVMNNQGGAPGVATPGVMLHAIETWADLGGPRIGDLTLDAWDVDGFLPKRYGRFGFKEYGRSHYDVEAYGEPSPELKSAWKQDGWKEGDPLPSVVYMKYEGPPEPGAARRNYIETGTIDRSRVSGPEPRAATRILPDDGDVRGSGGLGEVLGREQGREASDVRDAPGPAQSVRGPLDSFSRALRSLHDFSDAELVDLGFDPAEVRAIKPLPEQATLPFNPEERALLGIESVPENPDIPNPRLFAESDPVIRKKIGEYGSKNVLVNREAYEKAVQEIKDGMNRLNAGVDPSLLSAALKVAVYHAEAGLRSFADFVHELTQVVGAEAVERLREHLPSIWDQARLKALNYKVPGQGPEFAEPGYNQRFLQLADQYRAKVQEARKYEESEGFVQEAQQARARAGQLEGELLEDLLRRAKDSGGRANLAGATRQWMRTIIEAHMQSATSTEQLLGVLREKFDLDAGQAKDVQSILRANQDIVGRIQELVGGTPEQVRAPLDYMSSLQEAGSPLSDAFRKLGPDGRRAVRELQETYAKNNESLLNRLLKGADRVLVDKTLAMYKGFMLLGFKGPVNNFLSNLFNSLVLSASRPLRGGFDMVLSTLTGRRTRTAGFQSPGQGLRQAANRGVWNKIQDSLRGVDAEYTKYDVGRLPGMADGPGKTVAEMGFRLASAGDKPFYALAYERALREQGQLQATNEGLKGEAARARAAELVAQPTDGMVLEAGLQADYAVLSNKNALADAVNKGKAELKKGGPFAKVAGVASEFILPFVKVPLNAAGRALEFAGFGVLEGTWDLGKYTFTRFATERGLGQVRRTIEFEAQPGATALETARAQHDWQGAGRGHSVESIPFTQIFNPRFIREMFSMMPPSAQRKIADNLGNGITGLGLLWLGYVGYQRGLIRPLGGGDPEDWNEATATGNVPGGLRIGQYDIDLKSSVVGRILAAGATYGAWRAGRVQDADGNPDGVQAFNDVLKSVSDNPLVQGTNVLNRMSERPVQGLAEFSMQQLGTLGQPAFVRELSRLASPQNPVVERNNPADRWWSNVARGAQQPKTDVFGFIDQQTWAENLLGMRRNTHNPVASELQALGVDFTKPGWSKANKAKYGDPGVQGGKDLRADYTAKDYADRVAFIGMRVYQELAKVVADPEYRALKPAERKQELVSILSALRKDAGEELDSMRLALGAQKAHQEVWKMLREHNTVKH